jgi:hypothetical protein
MDRRQFVTGVAVSVGTLSGCMQRLNLRAKPRNETNTTTATPQATSTVETGIVSTDTPTAELATHPPAVTITKPPAFSLSGITATIEITRDMFGPSRVPRLILRLKNTTEQQRTLTYTAYRGLNLFMGRKQDGGTLLLLIPDQAERTEIHDCWKYPGKNLFLGRPNMPKTTTIDAKAVYEQQYTLWMHPKSKKCLPTGNYVFARGYETEQAESAALEFTLGLRPADS